MIKQNVNAIMCGVRYQWIQNKNILCYASALNDALPMYIFIFLLLMNVQIYIHVCVCHNALQCNV